MATMHTPMPGVPGKHDRPMSQEDLRKDRITLAVVMGIFAALVVLLIVLVSSGVLPATDEAMQPWIMP